MLRGAVAVADAGGIGSLTIRSLAEELGVKPMSVYHYVANKDEILDGIVDIVFSEIELPTVGWRLAGRDAAASALGPSRPSAPPLGDPAPGVAHRSGPGHAAPPRRDASAPCARRASRCEMTAHAYALLDSYVYGFALQEASLPFEGPDGVARRRRTDHGADVRPASTRTSSNGDGALLQPGYDFGNEFEFGLNLILDALTGLARGERPA